MRIKTNLFSTTILCRGIDEEFLAIIEQCVQLSGYNLDIR